jgi:hypothetical protein
MVRAKATVSDGLKSSLKSENMIVLSCTQPGSLAIRRWCSDGLRLKLLPRQETPDGLVGFV